MVTNVNQNPRIDSSRPLARPSAAGIAECHDFSLDDLEKLIESGARIEALHSEHGGITGYVITRSAEQGSGTPEDVTIITYDNPTVVQEAASTEHYQAAAPMEQLSSTAQVCHLLLSNSEFRELAQILAKALHNEQRTLSGVGAR